ncbi:MAG: hypothetical protein ACLGIK_08265, partial [Gemmatimonadota bacterium]
QDFKPLVYDSGNYPPAFEKAVAMIGYDGFAAEQARLRAGAWGGGGAGEHRQDEASVHRGGGERERPPAGVAEGPL